MIYYWIMIYHCWDEILNYVTNHFGRQPLGLNYQSSRSEGISYIEDWKQPNKKQK